MDPQVSAIIEELQGMDSLNSAAIAALRDLQGPNEAAGILYFKDGKYYYTRPVVSKKQDSFDIKAHIPKGAKIAGIYHTHSAGSEDTEALFSQADLDASGQLKVPNYMRVLRSNAYRVYTPGKSPVRGGARRTDPRYSYGEPLELPIPKDTSYASN